MARERGNLGVQEGVDGAAGVGKMLAELPDDPGSCIEHFGYPVLLRVAGEEVRVFENGGLEGGREGGRGREDGKEIKRREEERREGGPEDKDSGELE